MPTATLQAHTIRSRVAQNLPMSVRRAVWSAGSWLDRRKARGRLSALRRTAAALPPGSRVDYLGHRVTINDGLNFYMLYKDIVVRRIYQFTAQRPDPLILDCGSNVGLSILYFKTRYPQARVVGFEPDPTIYPYLEGNIAESELSDVRLVRGAIGGRDGTLTFWSDGRYGSCLGEYKPADADESWTRHDVPCLRLRDQLDEPVDFLKMNIEGAEWDALCDAGERLRQVREMVVEYHHLPGLPRTLHRILALLDECGFEYLVNDLDRETNPGACPPFRLSAESRYYLLIYARRRDG